MAGEDDLPDGELPRREISYLPSVSFLNVLPSRQNFVWEGSHSPIGSGLYSFERVASDKRISPLLLPEKAPYGDDLDELLLPYSQEASLHESDALSTPQAVFNLVNTVVGVGVLSVPYAFRMSGYLTLVLLLLVISVTSLTGKYIGRSLRLVAENCLSPAVPPRARDYTFLAHTAFGSKGRSFIQVVTSLELWFVVVTFMIMHGGNVVVLWPDLDRSPVIVFSCILSACMVFLPMKVFAVVSAVSSTALFIAGVAMVGAALKLDGWAKPCESLGSSMELHVWNMPRAAGILVFCFAGHPCFPIVYECMKDKRTWSKSVDLTFFIAFLYYGSLGVFGYFVFGKTVHASYTEDELGIPAAAFWRDVSILAFSTKLILTAPLLFNAVLVSWWAPGEREWPPLRVLTLAALAAATALTAVFFSKDVAVIASLTGSLFVMITSVLFPTLIHLVLSRRCHKWLHPCIFAQHCLVLFFGAVFTVVGTFFAVTDMLGWSTAA
mmetsp:Transcript_63588/g.138495  ORF Transcript_63588/g.138495 Transcript_63588/m.138495 type:complete len:494 (+) Transcript_63588:56-1537(+)